MTSPERTVLTSLRKQGWLRSAVPGRICEADGCTTVLSIYNSALFCWTHSPRKFGPSVVRESPGTLSGEPPASS